MKTSIQKLIISCFIVFLTLTTNAIAAQNSQSESDKARIFMLEKALAPDSTEAVANLFAKANKERNAAVQFMLFSDQLKTKFKDSWPNWVSGVSSPWITSYTIKKAAGKNGQYQITYQWATAKGPFQPPLLQTITVESAPQNLAGSQKFWISQFNEGN